MVKFRTVLFELLPIVTLAVIAIAPVRAYAAGTITVEQQSQINQYGSWRISSPMGMVVNRKKDQIRSINAEEGQYLLNVEAPEGAITTIRFFDGATLLNTTEGTQVGFTFAGNGTLRAEISYRYEGVIVVESTPSGARFELKGPQGVRQEGTTPATFTKMPPLYFTASFSPIHDCQQPRPQARTLRPNAELRFHADYTCTNEVRTMGNTPPPAGIPVDDAMTPATARMIDEQSRANVQLFHNINQSETVAGSTVYITIGVRNVSKSTLHNVILSEQYDSSQVSLPDVMQGGGMNRGNTAVWEIDTILAGQSFSAIVPVRIDGNVAKGDTATLTARVSGDDVHAPLGELLTKKLDVGVAHLPATGGEFGIIFILISALVAAFLLNPIIRRKQVVVPTAYKQ